MTPRSRIPAPNYTQAPNVLLDELLPDIGTLAELKVTLVVVRHTIGWHEDESKLSLADLETRTGLSRRSVIDGVKAGLERGSIERRIEGPKGAEQAFYCLNLASEDSALGLVKDLHQDQCSISTSAGEESAPPSIEGKKEERKTTPPDPLASEGEAAKWGRVLEDLRSTVPATTWHWLENVRLAERRGDVLVLQAPVKQARWVRDRFIDSELLEAATRVFGPSVELLLPESETEQMARELDERGPRQRRPRRRRAS